MSNCVIIICLDSKKVVCAEKMNDEVTKLKKRISTARRRIGVSNLLLSAIIVAPFITAAAVIGVFSYQFYPDSSLIPILYLLTTAMATGFVAWRSFSGLGEFQVAKRIDQNAGLSDRVSSALEFARIKQPTPFMQAAVADAIERARNINYRAAFPIWPRGTRRFIIATLVILPLLATGLSVDFASMFQREHTALSRDFPVDSIPTDVPDAPDLLRVEAPPRLAPLIEPVRNYIQAWKKNLEKMRREAAKRKEEFERQVTQAIFADSKKDSDRASIAGVQGLRTAITDDRIHLSDLQTMGVNETSEFKDAFAELDKIALEDEPEIEKVSMLMENMKSTADQKADQAGYLSKVGGIQSQAAMDADDVDAFKDGLKSAMQESFNDFLRSYANHLGELVRTKNELVEEAKKSGKPTSMSLSSAPPPKDAKLRMKKLNPKDYKKVQLSPRAFSDMKDLASLEKGSSKAGKGGGTAEGAIKTAKVESQTSLVELQGQMGEGKSPIQILEDIDSIDREDFSSEEYKMLYVDYTQGASELLNSEQIPLEIKSYIRDYFLSINPDKMSKAKPKKEQTPPVL